MWEHGHIFPSDISNFQECLKIEMWNLMIFNCWPVIQKIFKTFFESSDVVDVASLRPLSSVLWNPEIEEIQHN